MGRAARSDLVEMAIKTAAMIRVYIAMAAGEVKDSNCSGRLLERHALEG
jgi:hypothetical protein